jgi:hypothetical protein
MFAALVTVLDLMLSLRSPAPRLHGANPAIRDSEGEMPIDCAREIRHADILRILTEKTTAGRTQTRRKGRKSVLA